MVRFAPSEGRIAARHVCLTIPARIAWDTDLRQSLELPPRAVPKLAKPARANRKPEVSHQAFSSQERVEGG